jgi:hypothetical protein
MAVALGCSKTRVQRFLVNNNLKPSAEVIESFRVKAMTGRTTFNAEQDAFLKANYLTIPIKAMGDKIGKSSTGIQCRLRQLNLIIPRELIEQRKLSGRIKPGNTPLNKGKKWADFMSPEGMVASRQTTYKKGNLPHNTKFDGALSVRTDTKTQRPYLHLRLAKAKWIMLHVYMWEKENGLTPEGHIIAFADGNPANCDLNNLECITLAENMRRNTIHRLPDDIKSTIRLTMRLDRKITKLTKKLNNEKQKLGSEGSHVCSIGATER